MRLSTVTSDSENQAYFDIPEGAYGFHIRPGLLPKLTPRYPRNATYYGRPGRFPLTIREVSNSAEFAVLHSAGGFYSETPLPALRVFAPRYDTYSLWVGTAPGERYVPADRPLLGCWDMGAVGILNQSHFTDPGDGTAPASGNTFEAYPGVHDVTVYRGAADWGLSPETGTILVQRLVDNVLTDAHTNNAGKAWVTVGELPPALAVYTFRPPSPGLYRLVQGTLNAEQNRALIQASFEVG